MAKWHFGGKQNHKQKTSNKQHRTLISYNSDGLQISALVTHLLSIKVPKNYDIYSVLITLSFKEHLENIL